MRFFNASQICIFLFRLWIYTKNWYEKWYNMTYILHFYFWPFDLKRHQEPRKCRKQLKVTKRNQLLEKLNAGNHSLGYLFGQKYIACGYIFKTAHQTLIIFAQMLAINAQSNHNWPPAQDCRRRCSLMWHHHMHRLHRSVQFYLPLVSLQRP